MENPGVAKSGVQDIDGGLADFEADAVAAEDRDFATSLPIKKFFVFTVVAFSVIIHKLSLAPPGAAR
jgi:hypothetical protein